MTDNKQTMRFNIVSVIACIAMLSCSSSDAKPDPADMFVGTYNVSVTEYVVWGNDSGTLSDNGMFRITKESSTKIRIDGCLNTTGEVSGSTLYLNGFNSEDSAGQISTTFQPGKLEGRVLSFTANRSGQLKSGSKFYPYHSTDVFTAIMQ